jgi:hypothetical protein
MFAVKSMFWSPNIVYVSIYACYKHCAMLDANKLFVFVYEGYCLTIYEKNHWKKNKH